MDSDKARAILSTYRPGIDDNDPLFADALEQAEQDPELAEWLAEEAKHFAKLSQKFRSMPVPPALAEKIVRERPIQFRRPSMVLQTWQIAAGIAILAGVAGFFIREFTNRDASSSLNRVAAVRVTDGTPITVTGEVLDMACYIASNLSGPEHAECARTCIRNGLPVGIKAPDGKAYLLVGANMPLNAQLADYAAKTVTVKGIVRRREGFLMLDQVTIEKL